MIFKGKIVDTTLRDGEQSAGIAFSREDKVKLALKMDEAGIFQIEVGNPSLSIVETEILKEIMAYKKQAVISAWCPMEKEAIRTAALGRPDIIHISAPVSYGYIYSVLNKNKQWLRSTLEDCVLAGQEGGQEVTVGFEDASRADISFVVSIAAKLQEMGVKRIRYADTVGILTPSQVRRVMQTLKHYTDLEIEMHVHNDFGLAVANSIEAVKSGARYIDCTFLGIGERAGNCDFVKFIKASEEMIELGVNKYEIFAMQKEVLKILKGRNEGKRGRRK